MQKQKKKRYVKYTFLSGIKTKRPTKQTTKRKPVIQPNPGSLIAPGLLPSFPTPDNLSAEEWQYTTNPNLDC